LLLPILCLYAAAPAPSASPFEVDLELDLQLTLTGLLFSTGPQFLETAPDEARSLEPLPLSILPGLDRSVVGNDSDTARSWSDRLLYMQLALPFAINLIDNLMSDSPGRLGRFGTESMVLLEAAAMTSLLTVLVKTAVRRPRPYMFQDGIDEETRESRSSHESFFSGHTAVAFSMATSYSYLYQKKHPDSPAVIPIWVASHLVASSVALLRVEGGRHFWTDVATGAAVGSAVGFLVPWLHERGGDGDDDDIGIDDVRIIPTVNSRFFGLTAMWFF
jgi:membrane-associated phospholipid phosphatase